MLIVTQSVFSFSRVNHGIDNYSRVCCCRVFVVQMGHRHVWIFRWKRYLVHQAGAICWVQFEYIHEKAHNSRILYGVVSVISKRKVL
jgi:hypothetical protein